MLNVRGVFFWVELKPRRLSAVDGIRGMAFLFVFLVHSSTLRPQWVPNVTGAGKIGVWLFFVLSAFLLTHYFSNQPERVKNPLEWFNYIFRRFFRIFPLYVVVLLVYFSCKIVIVNLHDLKMHLVLQEGFQHLWTMPVETRFYLLLPVVVFVLVVFLRNKPLLAVVFLLITTFVQQYFFPYFTAIENSINLLQYIPVFLMGSCAAIVHVSLQKKTLGKRIRNLLEIVAILILGATLLSIPVIRFEVFGIEKTSYLMNKFLFFGFGWSVFIICVLNGSGYLLRMFEVRIFKWLGSVSYAAYLIHWLFIAISSEHYHDFTIKSFAVVVGGTFLFSWVLHMTIEKPLSKLNLLSLSGRRKNLLVKSGSK